MYNPDYALLIKDVSIYLRKSRNKDGVESDETLEKHRKELVEFAKKNNWRYTIYPEVVSGDKIDDRPEMIRLLNDIEEGLWDATLVMDIDRLGRGDEENSGKIKRIYRESETLIITPNKIYNLENEDDETYLDFQTFLARQEYKIIKKRLLRGRKQGAKNGNWTAGGSPPLPYKYNASQKLLVVDQDKLNLYNMMKKMCLEDLMSFDQIAWHLNKMNIPTPRNSDKGWKGSVIRNLLSNEIHLGKIIFNKTKGKYKKGNKMFRLPREQWIIVENCHEAVKTQEEHEQILKILEKFKHARNSRDKQIFSSLVKCKVCGRTMQINRRKRYDYRTLFCATYDKYGERCTNKGIREEELVDKFFSYMNRFINKNYIDENMGNEEIEYLQKQLIPLKEQVRKHESALNIIYQMREDGEYTNEQFLIRKEKRLNDLNNVLEQIKNIEQNIQNYDQQDIKKIADNFNELKKRWDNNLTPQEKNYLLSRFVETIIYYRSKEDGKVLLDIDFV